MPVAGLVITLGADDAAADRAMSALAAQPGLTLGERRGRWLAVALEAPDDAASRELHDWIAGRDGVEFVDVVSVEFDESSPETMEARHERGS